MNREEIINEIIGVIIIILIIAVIMFIKKPEKTSLIPLSENGIADGIVDGGGMVWTEKIKVDNPDGTYSYKYKDHYDVIVASGSGGVKQELYDVSIPTSENVSFEKTIRQKN